MSSSQEMVLGEEGLKKVEEARIFMVGCGGIGCELLKDLVGAGFRKIDIVRVHLKQGEKKEREKKDKKGKREKKQKKGGESS